MRYLGIDHGTKRVGLALSDISGRMAFPYEVVPMDSTLIERLLRIIQDKSVEAIVLGESKDYKGDDNPIMHKIRRLKAVLEERARLPIFLVPEVLSSREAMHIQGDTDQNDASAAAIVLQSYLDRINPPREENDA